MKQITLLILTSLFFFTCKKDKVLYHTPFPVRPPTYFTFNGQIGTNDNSTLTSIDSNLILCGNSNSNLSVLKISKAGSQIWRQDFSAGNGSIASGIAETNSQELFICGYTSRNYSTSRGDVFID